MAKKLKITDGSTWAVMKKLGFDANAHKPHWTFGANGDLRILQDYYKMLTNMDIDYITTNTYHFGSTLDKTLSPDLNDSQKYEEYFKNACKVLQEIVNDRQANTEKKIRILGSVGTLATRYHDCSEYHGNYIDHPSAEEESFNYFSHIFSLFKKYSEIRTLIVETIPTEIEGLSVLKVLQNYPDFRIVISFTMKEDGCLRHGESIESIASNMINCPQVIGIGINCTDPENVLPALKKIEKFQFKHVFVYPNIGDQYFLVEGAQVTSPFNKSLLKSWVDHGANVFGGCCGVDEIQLAELKKSVEEIGNFIS